MDQAVYLESKTKEVENTPAQDVSYGIDSHANCNSEVKSLEYEFQDEYYDDLNESSSSSDDYVDCSDYHLSKEDNSCSQQKVGIVVTDSINKNHELVSPNTDKKFQESIGNNSNAELLKSNIVSNANNDNNDMNSNSSVPGLPVAPVYASPQIVRVVRPYSPLLANQNGVQTAMHLPFQTLRRNIVGEYVVCDMYGVPILKQYVPSPLNNVSSLHGVPSMNLNINPNRFVPRVKLNINAPEFIPRDTQNQSLQKDQGLELNSIVNNKSSAGLISENGQIQNIDSHKKKGLNNITQSEDLNKTPENDINKNEQIQTINSHKNEGLHNITQSEDLNGKTKNDLIENEQIPNINSHQKEGLNNTRQSEDLNKEIENDLNNLRFSATLLGKKVYSQGRLPGLISKRRTQTQSRLRRGFQSGIVRRSTYAYTNYYKKSVQESVAKENSSEYDINIPNISESDLSGRDNSKKQISAEIQESDFMPQNQDINSNKVTDKNSNDYISAITNYSDKEQAVITQNNSFKKDSTFNITSKSSDVYRLVSDTDKSKNDSGITFVVEEIESINSNNAHITTEMKSSSLTELENISLNADEDKNSEINKSSKVCDDQIKHVISRSDSLESKSATGMTSSVEGIESINSNNAYSTEINYSNVTELGEAALNRGDDQKCEINQINKLCGDQIECVSNKSSSLKSKNNSGVTSSVVEEIEYINSNNLIEPEEVYGNTDQNCEIHQTSKVCNDQIKCAFNRSDSLENIVLSEDDDVAKVTTFVKKVEGYFVSNAVFVIATQNYEQYQSNTFQKMEHVIELFDIPKTFAAKDLLCIYTEKPRYIKWCDDHHALLITTSSDQANRALLIKHDIVKSRPMIEASPIASMVACNFELLSAVKSCNKQLLANSQQDFGNEQLNNITAQDKTAEQQMSKPPSIPQGNVFLNHLNSQELNYSNNTDTKSVKDDESKSVSEISSPEVLQIEITENAINIQNCNVTITETRDEPTKHVLNISTSDVENNTLSMCRTTLTKRKTLIDQVNKKFKTSSSIVATTESYDQYQNAMFQRMEHIIEVFDIPETFNDQDLLNIYTEVPRYIKWCDSTHALLVTGSSEQAHRALLIDHEIIRSRAMVDASILAVVVSCEFILTPALSNNGNKKILENCNNNSMHNAEEGNNDATPEITQEHAKQITYRNDQDETISNKLENNHSQKSSLSQLVSKYFKEPVTIVDATENYEQYQNVTFQRMAHIIEIYNIPSSYSSQDLLDIYCERPRKLTWCDDSHALLVTASPEQANRALLIKHHIINSRPMLLASPVAAACACTFDMLVPPVASSRIFHFLNNRPPIIAEESEEEPPNPQNNQPGTENDTEKQTKAINPEPLITENLQLVGLDSTLSEEVGQGDYEYNQSQAYMQARAKLSQEGGQGDHEHNQSQACIVSNVDVKTIELATTKNIEEPSTHSEEWEPNTSYDNWY